MFQFDIINRISPIPQYSVVSSITLSQQISHSPFLKALPCTSLGKPSFTLVLMCHPTPLTAVLKTYQVSYQQYR